MKNYISLYNTPCTETVGGSGMEGMRLCLCFIFQQLQKTAQH